MCPGAFVAILSDLSGLGYDLTVLLTHLLFNAVGVKSFAN